MAERKKISRYSEQTSAQSVARYRNPKLRSLQA
jgi:hypothetical protein